MPIRSKAYAMSSEVIGRLTGGPNMTPSFSVNVYVSPSSETSPRSVGEVGNELVALGAGQCL